jgi:hypothetical protein
MSLALSLFAENGILDGAGTAANNLLVTAKVRSEPRTLDSLFDARGCFWECELEGRRGSCGSGNGVFSFLARS